MMMLMMRSMLSIYGDKCDDYDDDDNDNDEHNENEYDDEHNNDEYDDEHDECLLISSYVFLQRSTYS